MPTYVYKCSSCHHVYERFHKMSDDPDRLCPSCGQEAVHRLPTMGGGFLLKGSGYYATDYGNPSSCSETEATPTDGNATGCCPCGKSPKGGCSSTSEGMS